MLTMQLQAKSEALVGIEQKLAANTIVAGNASRSASAVDINNTEDTTKLWRFIIAIENSGK